MIAPTSRSSVLFERLARKHKQPLHWARIVSPLLVYLLISVALFGPRKLSDLTSAIFCNSSDPQQFIWYYNWWPYSMAHHLNPFVTYFDWAAKGFNITWSTSIAALALLMAPVTMLGGAVLSFNLVALASPVLSALAAFYLMYYMTSKYVPSLVAGYIYGFGTFEISELLGHPMLYASWIIPLLVFLAILRLRHRIQRPYFVIVSSVLLVLQFGISVEEFAALLLFSGVAIAIFYLVAPQLKAGLRVVFAELAASITVAAVLMSPYLYYMVKGYSEVPSSIHPISAFSANLLNFVIPSAITLIGGSTFQWLSRHFTGNISETGAYFGVPLLAILSYIAATSWRNRLMRALAVLFAVIVLFAMGPWLHLVGHYGDFIPLPYALVAWLPLLKSALPVRFLVFAWLIAGVAVGWWLANLKGRSHQLGLIAAAVAVVCIIPNPSSYWWTRPSVPAVFREPGLTQTLPKDANIVVLPFERRGSSIYYQYASKMSFKQAGGYIGFVPTYFAKSAVVSDFLGYSRPGTGFASQLNQFCAANNVRVIVVLPQTSIWVKQAVLSLQWPTVSYGQAKIISVPYAKRHDRGV